MDKSKLSVVNFRNRVAKASLVNLAAFVKSNTPKNAGRSPAFEGPADYKQLLRSGQDGIWFFTFWLKRRQQHCNYKQFECQVWMAAAAVPTKAEVAAGEKCEVIRSYPDAWTIVKFLLKIER